MIAKLLPSTRQIRGCAESALNVFDTLDLADAAEHAKNDLRALLLYLDALDRADDPILVLGIEAIKAGVRSKVICGDMNAPDASYLESADFQSV